MKVIREHHHRSTPYQVEARRPLHQQTNGANIEADLAEFAAYRVRNARQASNCALPQTQGIAAECADGRYPQRWYKTTEIPPAHIPGEIVPPPKFPTCAKIACDNNDPDLNSPRTYAVTDTKTVINDARCCVNYPPRVGTQASIFGSTTLSDRVRGSINNTAVVAVGRQWNFEYYQFNPECTALPWQPGTGAGGRVFDIDPNTCLAGQTDAVLGRQIQCDVGLRPNCSTVTPTPNPSVATATLTASSVVTGIGSTIAALVSPTPTAAIAASAPVATVTAVGVVAGVVGAGVVVAGGAYALYRCAKKTEVPPPVALTQVLVNEESLNPFERS